MIPAAIPDPEDRPMPVTCLHDRDALERFFQFDPILHLYSLGDLDPRFWPFTAWFGRVDGGNLREVVLLYLGLALPTVQVFASHDPGGMAALLRDLLPVLPPRFHAHLGPPELEAVLREQRTFSPYGLSVRMRLADPAAVAGPDPDGLATLGPRDEPEVRALLNVAYPANFFEASMLGTGTYVGIRRRGALVALAGLHVLSERYQAAALGNVTTHPDARGQGLGIQVTAALCRRLLERGVRHIGLNVREANVPARALYARLGFLDHLRYQEGVASV